jgi:hypothetical protein
MAALRAERPRSSAGVNTLIVALSWCFALTACLRLSGPDCKDETRSLAASARLLSALSTPLPGDTGRANISLYEARDATTKATAAREILWFVGSGLSRADVSAVHVHEQGTGQLLFAIPIEPTQAPPFVITQVFTRQPYAGPVDWIELYERIGNERTYVDVHTNTHPEGQLRGELRRDNSNWQAFTHAYCS